ncbi:MAG: aminopeptidase P family protein [Puniceicoccales bacterium]|jgi:Xaa-Pro aminopeptidase|nr:aminopeptidase P family protein [Puniceicoccales bacterium]
MTEAYLIYASSDREPNLFYWGHFRAPDPFLALKINEKTIAVVSALEYGRCKKDSTFSEVLLWSDILQAAVDQSVENNCCKIILYLQKEYDVSSFIIPDDFPAHLYETLKKLVPIKFDTVYFQTQRQFKSASEVEQIKTACQLTSQAILYARAILKKSCTEATQPFLHYQGKVLTSERLRGAIECYCLKKGGHCAGTIVSCSQQAADPHCEGTGPLYANEFIVIDVFPRLNQSGYYGDMTRTFLKGVASIRQKQLFSCVQACQRELIGRIRPGVNTKDLMQFAQNYFERNGFGLRKTNGVCEGFIHSVGHGLGLGLHEYPSVGINSVVLEPNMVFTVEPGLYFHDLGGVRIEDVVQVTSMGCQLLSRCPYQWIL